MNIYIILTHNSPIVETTQMPFSGLAMNYHGVPFNNKKKWTMDTCNNLHTSPENYDEWKKRERKKNNPKWLHSVCFQAHNYSWKGEIAQIRNTFVVAGDWSGGIGRKGHIKCNPRDLCNDENVLHLHCINVLIMILYYSCTFTRCS